MPSNNYSYHRQVNMNFSAAVAKVKTELKKHGFGVLTEIDVKDTLKKKLNIDFNNYIILGACNPPYAHQSLQSEIEVGLMLPCNIIVYQNNEQTHLAAILPTVAMGMINNPSLKKIALKIEDKLKSVIDNV